MSRVPMAPTGIVDDGIQRKQTTQKCQSKEYRGIAVESQLKEDFLKSFVLKIRMK